MLLSAVTLFAAVLLGVTAQDVSLRSVKGKFEQANIPRDAAITFNPSILLEVVFPQTSGRPVVLKAGEQLTRNQTKGPPSFAIISSSRVKADRKFVVAAVDLDAPTPQNPTSAQIRHFLGGDFAPASRIRLPNVALLANSTPAISQFRQPTPPAGSDPHRYVFLLFNEPAGFDAQTEVTPTTSIALFNISKFAADVGLGNPLGGTFMLVGPDPPAA